MKKAYGFRRHLEVSHARTEIRQSVNTWASEEFESKDLYNKVNDTTTEQKLVSQKCRVVKC